MKKDDRIDGFLQRVERQIHTENTANDIREELTDHIECLIEDYESAGINENEAVSKALLQMGDPQEIGYSFTDYEGMKKRKNLMLFFQVTSILMLLISLLPEYLSEVGNFTFTGGLSDGLSLISNLIWFWLLLTTGSLIAGRSTKFLDIDSTPFAIVWPVKKRIKWEYLIMLVFFIPLIALFLFIYFYEEGINSLSILAMWPILTISYSVWAFLFKEKFRIPKVMFVDEGIIIKGRFTSWTGISSYTWTKDFFAKDQSNFKLVLDTFQPANGQKGMKRNISIHKRQYSYVNEFLRARI